MSLILMGNTAALDRGKPMPPGNRITSFRVPDGYSTTEALHSITDPGDGAWIRHSAAPPAWVESDDPILAAAISEHYGCPVGRLATEAGESDQG